MSASRRDRVFALIVVVALGALATAGCGEVKVERRVKSRPAASTPASASRERRLEGIRALTSGGANRQASFSPDASRIVWLNRPTPADPFTVRVMNADGGGATPLDSGPGRRFSPVFTPDGRGIVYAASGVAPAAASPDDDPTGVWLFDAALDLWRVDLPGTAPLPIDTAPGYDAEPSFSWGGAKLIHASLHEGRGALILSNADGSGAERVLEWPGYIGGPQLSPDGSRVVFHAVTDHDTDALEIYTCDLAGGNLHRLTQLGVRSISPMWHPSQRFIVFASNAEERDFELFAVQPDGSGLERVTYSPGFDGFPAFARDGRQLLWTSQRAAGPAAPTQIFTAGWRD